MMKVRDARGSEVSLHRAFDRARVITQSSAAQRAAAYVCRGRLSCARCMREHLREGEGGGGGGGKGGGKGKEGCGVQRGESNPKEITKGVKDLDEKGPTSEAQFTCEFNARYNCNQQNMNPKCTAVLWVVATLGWRAVASPPLNGRPSWGGRRRWGGLRWRERWWARGVTRVDSGGGRRQRWSGAPSGRSGAPRPRG